MITHNTLTATLQSEWNEHIAYNLILGINAKLGYLNWKLTNLPGTAQAFVGLDIGRKNNRSVGASAFVLDAQGELIGWSTQELTAYQETFDTEALRNLLLDLIGLYQLEYQQPLKHLVIHRDGKLQNSEYQVLVELKEHLISAGLEQLDVVEVIKTGTCRGVELAEPGDCQNPDKGYAWNYCHKEAIVLTTGKWEAKINRTNSSPRPLRIRQRLGETDLMVLAEQIYWLSEMQVGSTQTIRLPITTYYADRAAEWVLEKLLPSQVSRDKRLWFI
jgi:argonaute-like protein implicated in RNA metabolism and viral defense